MRYVVWYIAYGSARVIRCVRYVVCCVADDGLCCMMCVVCDMLWCVLRVVSSVLYVM